MSPDTYNLVQDLLQEHPVVLDLEFLRYYVIRDARATVTGGILPMLKNTRFRTISVLDMGDWYSKDTYMFEPSPPLSDLIDTSQLPDLETVSLTASVNKADFKLFESPSRIPEILSGQHDDTIFIATMRDHKYHWRPKPVTTKNGYLVSAKGRAIHIEVCASTSTCWLLSTPKRSMTMQDPT